MSTHVIDIVGQKFGRLTVVEIAGHDKLHVTWKCLCDCGAEKVLRGDHLKNGRILSCGCLHNEMSVQLGRNRAKHGMSRTRLYKTWLGMRARCDGAGSEQDKKHYHDRGIRVCDDWNGSFETFRDWALSNGYQDALSIDRINNDGNYCPDNCRWTSRITQNNNKSNNRIVTINGQSMTIAEAAREQGINVHTLAHREQRKRRADA